MKFYFNSNHQNLEMNAATCDIALSLLRFSEIHFQQPFYIKQSLTISISNI